ncbi:hypothetical protein KY290_021396 [Solanum tuberosum]|uniref:Uncharacterized protein n=1 Tax=Solanum tuberosum TaxID=4113 RepID=A0ABQ7V2E8_SOLTU|nr:hypothetical protein KY289_020561 [Solanum tuberosum]KAH0693228.1 hypothetical protein KY285_020325 [Solanum tuberosum]KAH0757903.1 hypothetical protein KY290_021396 [Solanum tuberosum]
MLKSGLELDLVFCCVRGRFFTLWLTHIFFNFKPEWYNKVTIHEKGACKYLEEDLLKVEKDVDSVAQIEFNKHGSKSAEQAATPSPEKGTTFDENTIVGMEDDLNTLFEQQTI